MKKEKAEQIVSEYMNQIFSYVSKRVSNEQDRYDLVQNICLQLYHSFCIKDVGRILRTFKIKKNVEVTDNGKIII